MRNLHFFLPFCAEEGDAIAKELWGYQGNESGQEHEDKSCPSASSPEHRTPTMIELHKRS